MSVILIDIADKKVHITFTIIKQEIRNERDFNDAAGKKVLSRSRI